MKIPESLKLAVLALLAPLLLLGILEAAARIYESGHKIAPFDFDSGFSGLSSVFVPKAGNPSVMTTRPEKIRLFSTQEFSAQKAPGTFRVVFLGESSVANLKLTEYLPKFRAQLKSLLPPRYQTLEILNLGAPSYGSQRIAYIAHEMLGYDPDLFLIYMGHNEFEEVEQFHLNFPSVAPVLSIANHSALFRLGTNAMVAFQVRRLERLKLGDRPRFELAVAHPFTERDVGERMASFRTNLENILSLCAGNGVPVVIGSVPSNLKAPNVPGEFEQMYEPARSAIAAGDFERARLLGQEALARIPGRRQSSSQENQIIRDEARKFGLPLADVEQAVIRAEPHHLPGETLFKDHCHLNEQGNQILLGVFFETIRRNPQVLKGH